jgi:glycosyltransferase involved in cell wall biosynthesis
MVNNVTLVVPTYNNLQHIKNAYTSIRKYYPTLELVLLDDGSSDGTFEWLELIEETDENVVLYQSEERVGHTILYDVGIDMAKNEIIGIIHADMIVSENYLENLLKHLDKGKVVCATRIEPPLHPPGNEKIIQNFGMDFDDLNIPAFEEFVVKAQSEYNNQTSKGMFAPWILYKEDFQSIGGHDPLFAPFPYEDSDIFQRWILAGFELIQSRDSFVYHLTCRGHRWNDEIQKDDDYYKVASNKAARNYLRKWGIWIENDSHQYPIISPKYNVEFRVFNCKSELLKLLEPWCDSIYVDLYESMVTDYIKEEQPNTLINLSDKINKTFDSDIIVRMDGNTLAQDDFKLIQQLPKIIQDSGEVGKFNLGNLELTINVMKEYQHTLINVT